MASEIWKRHFRKWRWATGKNIAAISGKCYQASDRPRFSIG